MGLNVTAFCETTVGRCTMLTWQRGYMEERCVYFLVSCLYGFGHQNKVTGAVVQ